jgi:hypothetical protein
MDHPLALASAATCSATWRLDHGIVSIQDLICDLLHPVSHSLRSNNTLAIKIDHIEGEVAIKLVRNRRGKHRQEYVELLANHASFRVGELARREEVHHHCLALDLTKIPDALLDLLRIALDPFLLRDAPLQFAQDVREVSIGLGCVSLDHLTHVL